MHMDTKAPTPLPKGQVLTVFLVQLCEGININVLFPFVAFMVEDFGYTGKELGYHVGALAATFCLAQFVSAMPWGSLSDRIGRKPPVVLGVLGSAVGMVVLGMSRAYWQAIAGRAISGLLTGNVGILKSFLTEITDDSNRGHGFSLMSLGWSLGTIVGPLAGGLLSYPAVKYPSMFSQHGIFAENPFLLPCLLCVACNVFAGLVTALCMEESRWKKSGGVRQGSVSSSIRPSETAPGLLGRIIAWVRADEVSAGAVYEELDTTEHAKDDRCVDVVHDTTDSAVECADNPRRPSGETVEPELDTDTSFSEAESRLLSVLGGPLGDDETGVEMVPLSDVGSWEEEAMSDAPKSSLASREVFLAISSYGLCAMGYIVIDETIPLMLKLDRSEGGLSYNSSEIGTLIALGGFTMLIWNIFLLPKISHHSKLWLFKTFNIVCIPVALSYPALASVSAFIFDASGEAAGREIVFSLYVVIMTAKNCLATIIFLAVMIFVNHSVEDDQLGAVNGLGQTVAAGARAIGPAAGGFLWSLGARLHFIYINYICAVGIFLLMQYIVHQLPSSIDGAKSKHAEAQRSGAPLPLQHGNSPVEEYEAASTLLQAPEECSSGEGIALKEIL